MPACLAMPALNDLSHNQPLPCLRQRAANILNRRLPRRHDTASGRVQHSRQRPDRPSLPIDDERPGVSRLRERPRRRLRSSGAR